MPRIAIKDNAKHGKTLANLLLSSTVTIAEKILNTHSLFVVNATTLNLSIYAPRNE